MLNKEMLLTSQVNSATDNIVDLWVGDGGVGDYGYCGSTRWGVVPCGTLDRIPYWYGTEDAYFALDLLIEYPEGKVSGTKFGTYYPDSAGTPSKGQYFNIKVTRCDTQQSITFSGEHGQLSYISNITVLGLMDAYMNSHHVTLAFDPPPRRLFIVIPAISLMEMA